MADLGVCDVTRLPMGIQKCYKGNLIKMFRKPFLGVPGFTFDSYADFMDQAVWNAAIAAGNIYPLELIEAVENTSIEQSVVDTDGGNKKKTKDGRYGFKFDMDLTLEQNAIVQDYGNLNWTLFIADDDDNMLANSADDTTVGGFTLSYFNVEPMMPTLGSDDYSKTKVEFQLKYNREMNQDILVAVGTELDWSPMALEPVTRVTISDISILSFVITTSLYFIADNTSGLKSSPVLSIAPENLIVIDQAGSVVTLTQPDIIMTSTPGIWEITTPAMTSGTIQLVASASSLFDSAQAAVTA